MGEQKETKKEHLQVEVCREFLRGQCARSDQECKFAHPPPNVDVQQGRVTACYDSIKVCILFFPRNFFDESQKSPHDSLLHIYTHKIQLSILFINIVWLHI